MLSWWATVWHPFRLAASYEASEEDRLVAAAKYGDSEAFERLIELYAPRLNAVARRLIGDDLAADIVQDAFLAAHRGLGKFRGAASFSTWLHKIVINRCRQVAKRQRIHEPLADNLISEHSQPEQQLEATLLREGLEQALRQLPEPFRLALSLREFSELSYAEIATVLGTRQGTVKSRIARARAMLKEVLEREGFSL